MLRAEGVLAAEAAGTAHPLDCRVAAHSWGRVFVAGEREVHACGLEVPAHMEAFDFADKNAFPQEFVVSHPGYSARALAGEGLQGEGVDSVEVERGTEGEEIEATAQGGAAARARGGASLGKDSVVHSVSGEHERIACIRYQPTAPDTPRHGHLAVLTRHGHGSMYTVDEQGTSTFAWSMRPPRACEAGWAGVAMDVERPTHVAIARQFGQCVDLFDGER